MADYNYSSYFVDLDPDTEAADIFRPTFWTHVAKRLKLNDIIRVRAGDGSFDFQVTVIRKDQAAVLVDVWPKYPVAAASVAEASAAIGKVAAEARTTLTSTKVLGKPVPRVEWTKVTKHRVIGLDGSEYASGFETRADAQLALDKYIAGLGITNVESAA